MSYMDRMDDEGKVAVIRRLMKSVNAEADVTNLFNIIRTKKQAINKEKGNKRKADQGAGGSLYRPPGLNRDPSSPLLPLQQNQSKRVFGLDVEKVQGLRYGDGTWSHHAGHVVVVEGVKRDGKWTKQKIIDEYILVPDDRISNYCFFFSKLTKEKLANGKTKEQVAERVLDLVDGSIVVTLAGKDDLECLFTPAQRASSFTNFELHKHGFVNINYQPLGLGPLCDYLFGDGVVVDHNCEDDAWYTLLIYLEHVNHSTGLPVSDFDKTKVMPGKKYRETKKLQSFEDYLNTEQGKNERKRENSFRNKFVSY